MPGENIQDWSVSATSNGNADTSINWAEGQPRASVNNSSRSMMAAHAKDRNLKNGSIVTGGTANAQTFFSGLSYTTVPTGLRARLKISVTNTGPATLNMDNIGAVAVKNQVDEDVLPGELLIGSYVEFLYDGTSWIMLHVPSGVSSAFTTGDAKITLKTVADFGWVMMNDGTIGSATSGASTRANADVEHLFLLLFANISDAAAPILTSAGAATTRAAQTNAATAWTANCRMTLPWQLGRSLAVAGAGSGLTSRPLGSLAGAETETPTIGKTATHDHALLTSGSGSAAVGAVSGQPPWGRDGSWNSQNFSFTSVGTQGNSGVLNILDPTTYWNVMVKL